MKKGALALFLLLLAVASHGTWCEAAPRRAMAGAALQPHEIQGQRLLEMSRARKLGHTGGRGSGGGASGAGRHTGTGGGAVNTRPHNTKNGGAVALPALVTSALALVFTTVILLSALSF
ncbi:hypothetical protein CFC21_099193 [Triticum aestivum]|uniref:Uncharacterized protein n=3 Tax=Triticum TaxID=4564 RepID=A0A9R1BRY9_TRITD|nr:uncharacterized protein LOC119333453 isoform X1 [Triticum dicoccoides]XP_044428029.1 uncharacterized protein LOC123152585 [Triticum aestivum]KAF7097369.1 hypothetical protein CFC21_099193 [Triticum aestivum]VAI78823.1 unnamed protein product [Triticum turgidum subsp. durum]